MLSGHDIPRKSHTRERKDQPAGGELTNPFFGKQMFIEATKPGDELEITRADLDRWALRSHELALKAIDEGHMSEEIVSVTIKNRKDPAHPTVVDIDEGPRRDTSLEKLAAHRRAPRLPRAGRAEAP